jgi:hypothetical protein
LRWVNTRQTKSNYARRRIELCTGSQHNERADHSTCHIMRLFRSRRSIHWLSAGNLILWHACWCYFLFGCSRHRGDVSHHISRDVVVVFLPTFGPHNSSMVLRHLANKTRFACHTDYHLALYRKDMRIALLSRDRRLCSPCRRQSVYF